MAQFIKNNSQIDVVDNDNKSQTSSIFHYDLFQERKRSYNINIVKNDEKELEKDNNDKRRTQSDNIEMYK